LTSYYCRETRRQCEADWPSAESSAVDAPEAIIGHILVFHQCWTYVRLPRISRGNARFALYKAGLLAQLELLIQQAGMEATIWYEEAFWERTHPYVISMGSALGLTSQEIDGLFMSAAEVSP